VSFGTPFYFGESVDTYNGMTLIECPHYAVRDVSGPQSIEWSFGLIDCSGCVLTPAKTGLVRVRMDHVRKFWRV